MSFLPDWVSAPGDTIREVLDERGISVVTFQASLNESSEVTLGVLSGSEPITTLLAEKLSRVIGSSVEFWLRREENYQKALTRLGKTRP